MKIKIKRNLLNESKLDSYSNIWKSWKTIGDFAEWNRSQVLALAKYRKGQGKFDFRFYDKVYNDLKHFIEHRNRGVYDQDDYISNLYKNPDNIFWTLYYLDGEIITWEDHINVNRHRQPKKVITFRKTGELPSDWTLRIGRDIYEDWYGGRYYQKTEYTFIPNVEPLKEHLKNMESLRESYPWNKKHLPNIQKHLGIYEKKIKNH